MRYLFIILLLISSHILTAQSLVVNGSFEDNSGNDLLVDDECYTFSDGSMPGWTRSHGTPDLLFGSAPDGSAYIRMWSMAGPDADYGEGVYNLLASTIQSGQDYTLCFTYFTTNHPGNLIFELVNDNPLNGTQCGDSPSSLTGQVISSSSFPVSDWEQVSVTFTANDNYTYLRIYPSSTYAGGPGDIPTLFLDKVNIFACGEELVLSEENYNGAVGFYQAYSISASNMMVNPSQNTLFRANEAGFVYIDGDFQIEPDEGVTFVIELGPCACPPNDIALRSNGNPEAEMATDLSGGLSNTEPVVAWNESSGIFQFKHYSAITSFTVYDLSGRTLMQSNPNGNNAEIDSKNFPAGVYIVRIVDVNGRTFGKRIVNPG